MNAPESLESGPGAFFGDRINPDAKERRANRARYGGLRLSLARLRREDAVGPRWDIRTSTSVPPRRIESHWPIAFAAPIKRPGPATRSGWLSQPHWQSRLLPASAPHTTWHLDEVYLKIDGRMVYLWRAVDAEGEVLDVLVQSKRNKHAALKLMRKLLRKYAFVPERKPRSD
jgi:DDE domain